MYEYSNFIGGTNLNKFKLPGRNPLTARDYIIDNVDQEGIDSCYLLSSLSARKDDIAKSKCMKWNDDGSCGVSLFKVKQTKPELSIWNCYKNLWNGNYKKELYEATDDRKTYHISEEELKQTDFRVTENGVPKIVKLSNKEDITAKAMEVALIKHHGNEVSFNKIGGTLEKTQKMLYGKNAPDVKETWAGRIKPEQIEKAAICQLPVKGGILSGSKAKDYIGLRSSDGDITVMDINNKPVTIIDKHAYTVNGYDKKTDSVSISNPHLNDLTSKKDDIVLPFKIFKNLFNIEYIDK